MATVAPIPPVNLTKATELMDAISSESGDVAALLSMLNVFFSMELRTVDPSAPDVGLSDAADGLAVLALDIQARVNVIAANAKGLYYDHVRPQGGAR
jgi:hypothetical protein